MYPEHKNFIYEVTWGESQRVMCWRLIPKEFWPKIQHISGVDNIVVDMLSRFAYTSVDQDKSITTRAIS